MGVDWVDVRWEAFFLEATSRVIFRVVDVIQKAEEDVLLTSLKEFKRCR